MDLSVVLVVVMMRAGRKGGLEIFGIESMGRALSELGEVAYRFDGWRTGGCSGRQKWVKKWREVRPLDFLAGLIYLGFILSVCWSVIDLVSPIALAEVEGIRGNT